MTDHRRAWINLAEALRVLHALPQSAGPWDLAVVDRVPERIQELPVSQVDRDLLHTIFYGGLADGFGVDGAAELIAMYLGGFPDFSAPHFLHHATSDDPDGKWSYQVAHPEGEWSRNPESPEDCLKIDIAPE